MLCIGLLLCNAKITKSSVQIWKQAKNNPQANVTNQKGSDNNQQVCNV